MDESIEAVRDKTGKFSLFKNYLGYRDLIILDISVQRSLNIRSMTILKFLFYNIPIGVSNRFSIHVNILSSIPHTIVSAI